jgi:hypothetical protein
MERIAIGKKTLTVPRKLFISVRPVPIQCEFMKASKRKSKTGFSQLLERFQVSKA